VTSLSQRLSRIQPALKQKKTRVVPFGEWLPDLPDFQNPGVLQAVNAIPDLRGYRPFPGLAAQTNALAGAALSAFSATDSANNIFVYAGDASALYEMLDLTWTDESKGGGYSTASDDVWEFAQFGTDIVATNFTDPVQFIATGGGAAGAFADLITSTNKPKAKHLDTVRDFLVLGNTNDTTDGHVPNRVWWSAINDATDFDPDATTQSDYQTMPEGGWVQRVVGGTEYGVIFQERQISRMEYVGWPLMFQFFPVDRKRGTPIPNSVVGHGRSIFYISEEGFYEFNGSASVPIGANKVDRTFWSLFDTGNKSKVSAAIDPVNKLVAWAFPLTGTTVNRMYIYNWVNRRWAQIVINLKRLVRVQTQGFTLDGLDVISTNIDTGFTESFDSDAWKGGKVRFAAMDADDKLAYFTGDNLAAFIQSTEVQPVPEQRSIVTSVRPLIDGTDSSGATVFYLNRARQQDVLTSVGQATINADGDTTLRSNGRYHTFILQTQVGEVWTYAQGLEITYSPSGRR